MRDAEERSEVQKEGEPQPIIERMCGLVAADTAAISRHAIMPGINMV
jgi:hypothetical protein